MAAALSVDVMGGEAGDGPEVTPVKKKRPSLASGRRRGGGSAAPRRGYRNGGTGARGGHVAGVWCGSGSAGQGHVGGAEGTWA